MVLCSFTTIVGYGSLLLSANQGIRSFGPAALIGEVTCFGAAMRSRPRCSTSGSDAAPLFWRFPRYSPAE